MDSNDLLRLRLGLEKSQLVTDLSSICEITLHESENLLTKHFWNIQNAIDDHLGYRENDNEDTSANNSVVLLGELTAAEKSRVIAEIDLSTSPSKINIGESENLTKIAPEKFSVISWNLDGLDEKNLERRTDAVIKLIEQEEHDVIFFQELIPTTFHFISRKLSNKYLPIPGTKDLSSQYLTGTFLRLNRIIYEDHYIVPYPSTVMSRNLLVTKAFIGKAKLFLLNTHLESTAEFSKERVSQLKIALNHCTSFPADSNVIFGGDLNLRDNEIEGLLPTNMCDLWVKCGSRESCRYTWDLLRNTNKQMPGKYQPRCRFDRFYFRNSIPQTLTPEFFAVTGIEKVEGTMSFPSDHWAILAFFKLRPEARQP